ncbi:MAG: septal ring lytic transglycosylase RlpA family protein [bacterium]|nr:septal ring lytic transglycosylase RlpA family protein [bacterium]MDT8365117.1 septal ring lytic transglycosylase RlpA family protein [bacterium]
MKDEGKATIVDKLLCVSFINALERNLRKMRFTSSFLLLPSLLLAAIVALSSCAAPRALRPPPSEAALASGGQTYRVMGQTYRVMGSSKGYVEKGMASWYGTKFHGRKTASGEIYDMEKFTSAHRTLPLGTYAKVKRTDGKGESIVVKVNDRGPFVDNRVIDLSRAAARQLDMLNEGVAPVVVTALGEEILQGKTDEITLRPRLDYNAGEFSVQVGAFTVKENAEGLVRRMMDEHGAADLSLFERGDMNFFRVRVGKFTTREEAERFRDQLLRSGEFNRAFVVAR